MTSRRFGLNFTRWDLILFIGFLQFFGWMACEDIVLLEEKCCNANPVHHVVLDSANEVYYNHPISLDLNEDGVNDYLFTVALIMNGQNVDERFVGVSTYDSRSKLWGENAMAYPQNILIGGVAANDTTVWSIESGFLLTRTIHPDLTESWSGTWYDHPVAYLGVSIRINGAYHYGWIKIRSVMEEKKLIIEEYALQNCPEVGIETGNLSNIVLNDLVE